MERQGLRAALLLALLVAALLAGALPRREGAPVRAARGALVDAVGLGSPALASGRELADGLLAPLADVPAGPCAHRLADAVAPPTLRVYTLRVVR